MLTTPSTGIPGFDQTIRGLHLGDNVVIKNVRYMANVIVGDETILLNIDELLTTDHAKFGNGILKDGEPENVRVWLEVCNETGGRKIMPFNGMLPADAFLWAKYRADGKLMQRLKDITDNMFDHRRGTYGTIDDHCVIKDCRILKDVVIGSHAYIKGANKLKNLTINSSPEEPTQIGEGVEMVNGIVGFGNRIFYGVKAVRFITGTNTTLKYGARLLNSYLGDNSTVSCCEMLNNLIFPAHEQHHNNSFLCAAMVLGQSNIAAGATIGSNHNSRANDGELVAGRGFWPGLCSNFKHNCRFASFNLVAKGSFPYELNVPLPFTLVSNNESNDCLQLMPGYWFLYNMYALARNSWKFAARDRRSRKRQHVEFDHLAPDTVEEMFVGRRLLEQWTGDAWYRNSPTDPTGLTPEQLMDKGREVLHEPGEAGKLVIEAEGVERSNRPVVVLKAEQGYAGNERRRVLYGGWALLEYVSWMNVTSLEGLKENLPARRQTDWVNLGGQLALREDVEKLKADIRSGALATWDDIHAAYDLLWKKYPVDKAAHAWASLLQVAGTSADELTTDHWQALCDRAIEVQREVARGTRESRQKDFTDPFKHITFDDQAEMDAVMGTVQDNGFIRQVEDETAAFETDMATLKTLC